MSMGVAVPVRSSHTSSYWPDAAPPPDPRRSTIVPAAETASWGEKVVKATLSMIETGEPRVSNRSGSNSTAKADRSSRR